MSLVFTETKNPDNIHKFIEQEQPEEITIGANAVHTFEFPFLYSELISEMLAIYKQGSEIVLEKTILPDYITEIINPLDLKEPKKTIIKIPLGIDETSNFKSNLLDTFIQLKFIAKDGNLYYNNRSPIRIKTPLDKEIL